MTEVISVDELCNRAAELVARVAAGGPPVMVCEGDRRLALLVPQGGTLEAHAVDKTEFGFDPQRGLVGSTTGRETLGHALVEMGLPIAGDLLDAAYAKVIRLCEEKSTVYRFDLRLVADEAIAESPGRLRLLALTVQTTSGMPATAEVTLRTPNGPAMRRQQGDGPLDAAITAIEKLTGVQPRLVNFAGYSATPGRDAMAEVVIELELEGRQTVGKGASTDSVEAAVLAYLNALNFLQTEP